MVLTDQQIAPIDTQARRAVAFRAGDTVRVHQKIVEKDKTRIQVFEGTVLARKHGTEPGATFTVRRVGTDGIAVEKIFPLYTPTIDRIEVVQQVKTRRAKLYFLRDRTPKQIREKLRNTFAVFKDTPDDMPEPEAQQQEQAEEKTDEQAQQDEQPKQEEQTTPPTEEQPKQEEKTNDTPEQAQPEQPADPPTPDKQPDTPQDSQPQPEANQEQTQEQQPDTPTQPTDTTPQPESNPPQTPDKPDGTNQ